MQLVNIKLPKLPSEPPTVWLCQILLKHWIYLSPEPQESLHARSYKMSSASYASQFNSCILTPAEKVLANRQFSCCRAIPLIPTFYRVVYLASRLLLLMPPSWSSDGFTTKAAQWEKPEFPSWTSQLDQDGIPNDGYDVNFVEKPPLELIDVIGNGSNGVVCSMRCTENDQMVAVKRIPIDPAREDALRSEVRNLRQLSHYHVLRICGTYNFKYHFHLMTLPVANCSLHDYLTYANGEQSYDPIQECGPPDKLLPTLFGCLANGLRYIHQERIKHMDINPSNIILFGQQVLFADFGIARRFTTRSTTDAPISRTRKVGRFLNLSSDEETRSQRTVCLT